MKWAATALCILGISAAICAAFLVNTLRASSVQPTKVVATTMEVQPLVQVLYATTSIPAMSVVDAKSVVVKSIPKNEAPKNYIDRPVEVVGRVVSVPVVEGQAFTVACFGDKATARQVADAIPFGKRAVGISVTDYAGLEGMLFPGSSVDVMVAFKPQEGNWEQAITVTLLENVQVLGIEQQTVVSAESATPEISSNISHGGARRVTLLVDTEQGKQLQLAMGYGTLSLALRNPLDRAKINNDSISVSKLLSDLAPMKLFNTQAALEKIAAAEKAAAEAAKEKAAAEAKAKAEQAPKPAPQWDVTVIRGGVTETRMLPMPKPGPETAVEVMSTNR